MFRAVRYEWRRRGDAVRFMLRARQNIPTGDRAKFKKFVKQEIRSQFHRQLKNLWIRTPFLKGHLEMPIPMGPVLGQRIALGGHQFYGGIVVDKERGEEFHFIPLLTLNGPWVCEHLDIRFLIRQDKYEQLNRELGDVDARVSLLFDALRLPHQPQELSDEQIEKPCFVLFEDDSLVHRISAETLHLLNDPNEKDPNKETPEQDHVVHVLASLRHREKEFNLFS